MESSQKNESGKKCGCGGQVAERCPCGNDCQCPEPCRCAAGCGCAPRK